MDSVVVIQRDDINPVLDLEHQAMVSHGQPTSEIKGGSVCFALNDGAVGRNTALEGFTPVPAHKDPTGAGEPDEKIPMYHS